jgi:hypothetical protein
MDPPNERAKSARKRSSAEGVGLRYERPSLKPKLRSGSPTRKSRARRISADQIKHNGTAKRHEIRKEMPFT